MNLLSSDILPFQIFTSNTIWHKQLIRKSYVHIFIYSIKKKTITIIQRQIDIRDLVGQSARPKVVLIM